MYAAISNNVSATKQLLSAGAFALEKDKHGKTALDLAKSHGSTDVIPLLSAVIKPSPVRKRKSSSNKKRGGKGKKEKFKPDGIVESNGSHLVQLEDNAELFQKKIFSADGFSSKSKGMKAK